MRLLCIRPMPSTVGKQFVTSFLGSGEKKGKIIGSEKHSRQNYPQDHFDGVGCSIVGLLDCCLLCDLLGCYYVKHNNQLSVWQAVCLSCAPWKCWLVAEWFEQFCPPPNDWRNFWAALVVYANIFRHTFVLYRYVCPDCRLCVLLIYEQFFRVHYL